MIQVTSVWKGSIKEEHACESMDVLSLLRHWLKLTVLYRMTRNVVTREEQTYMYFQLHTRNHQKGDQRHQRTV